MAEDSAMVTALEVFIRAIPHFLMLFVALTPGKSSKPRGHWDLCCRRRDGRSRAG